MKIICLCGSTKFKSYFESVNQLETLKGNIVLAPGVFGHADKIELSVEKKDKLDKLHLKKIDMSNEVIVIDVNKYIGRSTKKEIEYARKNGKIIKYFSKDFFSHSR